MEQPKIDDGGPAYPAPTNFCKPENRGMSLRDYFAGQALCGINYASSGYSVEGVRQRAYAIADAMIAARKETQ